MSRMSVKVPVKKVITQLEAKLKLVKKEYESLDRMKDEHEKAVKKWEKDVQDAVVAAIVKNPNVVSGVERNSRWRHSTSGYDHYFQLEVDESKVKGLPKKPERLELEYINHSYVIDEIEQMIRVLKMTDDEYVNATTLRSVTAYL